MAESPTVARATAKPATGTAFANVANSIANIFSAVLPAVNSISTAVSGRPLTSSGAVDTGVPQIIIQQPATESDKMDIMPIVAVGGLGLLGLGFLAVLSRGKSN